MNYEDRAIRFLCGQDWLYGVLSVPEQIQAHGVLILVGGGQYRIGSHRQFALLARHLSSSGIPVMRFDFRGVGDSEGQNGATGACQDTNCKARSTIFANPSPA